jgi:hypothetical protein
MLDISVRIILRRATTEIVIPIKVRRGIERIQ